MISRLAHVRWLESGDGDVHPVRHPRAVGPAHRLHEPVCGLDSSV